MLSSAIIVFREVFEIVLIIGIILAATKDMPNRNKAIYLGFAGGILGSVLVAVFMGKISDFAEGMGQEFFNALILFTAAGFIGWTILWMKRHAREMKAQFENLGQDVVDGKIPFLSLSLVIGLTILREGAEVVLFTYGMLASGQSAVSLGIGSVIGIAGGSLIGILLYKGLIKLSMHRFFQITTWLLVFLVAGMVSQAFGFLVAAGGFENFSQTMWNSSWLLDERGLIGQAISTLTGYTARPVAIQVIAYILTFGVLITLMKFMEKKSIRDVSVALIILGIGFISFSQEAHASKKVYAPYVELGEVELELRSGYDFDNDSNANGAWKQKYGVGYGVTERWFTEFYVEVKKRGNRGGDVRAEAVEWENRFQLTEAGEYWADFGLLLEYKHNIIGRADKGEAKLLVAKDMGKFTHLANFILEREMGEDASDDTEWGFSWGSRYRKSAVFEPGFEYHGGFGAISHSNSYSEQSHLLGPTAYGHIGEHLAYDVGALFGISDNAPDLKLKINLEYEWRF